MKESSKLFQLITGAVVVFCSVGLARADEWVYRDLILAERSGDVMARNLKVPGLGWLGHLGMYDAKTNTVLELLKAATPIVTMQNSAVDFMRASGIDGYWGAKYARQYGVQEVIIEGWGQRIFQPRYTSSASWTQGKWIPALDAKGRQIGYKKQGAVFRCDTFVAYSYQRSNQGLPSIFGTPQLPLITYRKMPALRPISYGWLIPRSWL